MEINAHKITQPFQLLASWLVGMLILVWEFLHVCLQSQELWLKICSFISATLFTIIFIWVIFRLQTKYRAEMQDGEHYQQIWMKQREQEVNKSKPVDIKQILESWQKK